MKKYILSIDQGTTGTTVLIIDKKITIKAKVNNEFTQHYPQPGWVEHDASEIWDVSVKTIHDAIKKAKIKAHEIAAISITNQRETTVAWQRSTSNPLYKAIVWQDRRTAPVCEHLIKKGLQTIVRNKTGLVLDAYFSGTKMGWYMKNVKKTKALALKKDLAFGTIDSWLVWKLTAGKAHVTDVSNASRTLLLNLKTLKWDKELLKIFHVPLNTLPKVCSSSEIYGYTQGIKGLPDGIPVAGIAGDQQAALFGQACFTPGEAKCTYGTGSFLLMNIGSKPSFTKSGLLTTVAWKIGNKTTYAFEGSAFIAGAAVQWLRDELKIIHKASDIEKLAKTVNDNGGVYFVPALAGLGSPHWNPHARGTLCGLTRGSNQGHIARATLEGIAFLQKDIVHAMQKACKKKLKTLKVDGGAVTNNLLMQFQADILDTKLVRPKIIETTALGSAFLAGLAVGFWKSQDEIKKTFKVDRVFVSKMNKTERSRLLAEWHRAIGKAIS
ncbi:MAG: glycerol kinase GlpK [bacterium]|nr:glycerol kinase GlpK [bacterium]